MNKTTEQLLIVAAAATVLLNLYLAHRAALAAVAQVSPPAAPLDFTHNAAASAEQWFQQLWPDQGGGTPSTTNA